MTYKLIQREPTPEMVQAAWIDGMTKESVRLVLVAGWDAAPQVDGYKLPELTTSEVLSLERRSKMTDDEAIRFARSVESLMMRKARGITAQYQPAAQSTAAQEAEDAEHPALKSHGAALIEVARLNRELADTKGALAKGAAQPLTMKIKTTEDRCIESYGSLDATPIGALVNYQHQEIYELRAALSQSAKEIKG